MADEILETGALDALLLTDLASDGGTGPDVQQWDELGESAQDTTVAHRLGVLPEGVAGAEVGDDAGRAVVETAEDPVTPLARHGGRLVEVLFEAKERERNRQLARGRKSGATESDEATAKCRV